MWIRQTIRLKKDALGGKVLREFAALSVKTYSYFTYNNNEDKKTTQLENRIEQLEKNKLDVVSLSLLFSLEMSSIKEWNQLSLLF